MNFTFGPGGPASPLGPKSPGSPRDPCRIDLGRRQGVSDDVPCCPLAHRGLCWRNQLSRWCCRTISLHEFTVAVMVLPLGFPRPVEPPGCHSGSDGLNTDPG